MKFAYHPFVSPVLAVAVWLSILPLGVLVQGNDFLWEAGLVLAIGGLVGMVLGLVRMPRPLIPILQAAAMAGIVTWRGLIAVPTTDPDRGWLERLLALWEQGMQAVTTGQPPIESDPGVVWALAGLTALLFLLTEILASQLEQPAWSLAPLSLPYLVSALSLVDDLDLPHLGFLALAFLLVLTVASSGGDGHLVRSASKVGANRAARGVQALGLGLVALLLTALIAPLVPLGPRLGLGSGNDGPIELSDPTVELSRNLRQPESTPVLTYRSSSGEGTYLRTVALSQLDARGMHLTPMSLSSIGLDLASNYPGDSLEVDVRMAPVTSEYLPVPFVVDSFDADGTWAFDPATMSVVGTGRTRREQTVDLHYSVEATVPSATAEELASAQAGRPEDADVLLALPELPPEVSALTTQVVGGAASAGQKALAIQDHLRSPAFSYSLQAPEIASGNTIADFLLTSRSGYCIHFATAMITMARLEGIPARMAIGFTPGTPQSDGSFAVTSHDMHAWPELYFEGLGWLPFEPTPGGTASPDSPGAEAPGHPTVPSTPSPSPSASESPDSEDDPGESDPSSTPSTPDETSFVLPDWLLPALSVVLLLLLPGALRGFLGRWRLRGGQPAAQLADAVLAEIRATFTDTGRSWPSGSPVPAAEEAAEQLDPDTARRLREIATHLEQIHYARNFPSTSSLPDQTRRIRRDMRRSATPMMRFLSVLWPRSLSPLHVLRKSS